MHSGIRVLTASILYN